MYSLYLARSARKELERLTDPVLGRIAAVLDRLPREPRPRGCKKLRGTQNIWRVRVGPYRIIYLVDDTTRRIEVRAIGDRKDLYE
ncbi:MAG: type II toxin-antitoxin system RelE/ParE family toxin [Gemmatimonadales bacterium]